MPVGASWKASPLRNPREGRLTARGLNDVNAFLSALEKNDAWPHAARPLDRDELIGFGTRIVELVTASDLTRSSVERKLKERDSNRDASTLLSVQRRNAAQS